LSHLKRKVNDRTSWSRTRVSKILKPCRCRTYAPRCYQNLPSVGPHGPQSAVQHRTSARLGLGQETKLDIQTIGTIKKLANSVESCAWSLPGASMWSALRPERESPPTFFTRGARSVQWRSMRSVRLVIEIK
jgi:hypothetical protein